MATDSRPLGFVVSDRPGLKLGVGYAADTVVSVPADAKDVLVEVSRRPFGPLVVEAPATGGSADPSLAVGDEAVKQPGASRMFARDADGKVDANAAAALGGFQGMDSGGT